MMVTCNSTDNKKGQRVAGKKRRFAVYCEKSLYSQLFGASSRGDASLVAAIYRARRLRSKT
jgi:hypothetical protein